MNKDKISAAFRKYVKDHLSPTFTERSFVSSVYEALCNVLGATHCLQIGSYPRFTANRPLHDLDVLYVNGPWPGAAPNPASLLSSLKNRIEKEFKNPTELVLKVSVQTHSITIRKSAKFVKAWKCACKKLDDTFKLKSFHMEQIITAYFRKNLKLDIYDAVLQFFRDLPKLIERAQIPDRADHGRNIDQYVEDLTDAEKSLILRARNAFLSKLEDFNEDSDVKDLIEAGFTSQPKGPASPAIITRRSPAGATGFTPRSPWASDHVVKRR